MEYRAEEDIWEFINNDSVFNDFVGKCVTHFEHFVIPRRDQEHEIEQDYHIPDGTTISSSSEILLRWKKGEGISISFMRW